MFYKEIYGKIYLAMETLNDKEGAFDYVTLSAYMQKHYLDDGILALQLIKRGIPSTYIERHCMIVLELYLKRQCIIIFSKLLTRYMTIQILLMSMIMSNVNLIVFSISMRKI